MAILTGLDLYLGTGNHYEIRKQARPLGPAHWIMWNVTDPSSPFRVATYTKRKSAVLAAALLAGRSGSVKIKGK